MEHFELDQYATNFPKDMFDPHGFPAFAFYDKLCEPCLPCPASNDWLPFDLAADAQKVHMERLEKQKKEGPPKKKEAPPSSPSHLHIALRHQGSQL